MEEIKELLEEFRVILARNFPALYFLLRSSFIYWDDNPGVTAYAVDNKIYLGTDFLNKQKKKQKFAIMIHELLHIIHLHTVRIKNVKYPSVYNLAADLIVNTEILQFYKLKLPDGAITSLQIAYEAEKDSTEDVYERLVSKLPEQDCQGNERGKGDSQKGEGNSQGESGDQGQYTQENTARKILGNKSDLKQSKDGNDSNNGKDGNQGEDDNKQVLQKGQKVKSEKDIKDIISKSLLSAKLAGKLKNNESRLLDSLINVKINWDELFRNKISSIGKIKSSSYTKRNRRLPGLMPGLIKTSIPTIHALIDVSGSISKLDYEKFISILYNAKTKYSLPLKVYFWDVGLIELRNIKTKKDLLKPLDNACGGTVLFPVLTEAEKNYKRKDYIIIMSDFYIGDIDKSVKKLKQFPRKDIILVSIENISKGSKFNDWKIIKVD